MVPRMAVIIACAAATAAVAKPTSAGGGGPALALTTRRTLGDHLAALFPPWHLWLALLSTTGTFTLLAFKWWPWHLRFVGIGAAVVAAAGESVVSGGAGFRLSTILFASCAAMAATASRVPIPEGGWVCPLALKPSKDSEASKDCNTPGIEAHPGVSALFIALVAGFVAFCLGAFWNILLLLFRPS